MPVKSLKRFIHRNVIWSSGPRCVVVTAVAQQGAPAKVSSSHRCAQTGRPVPPTDTLCRVQNSPVAIVNILHYLTF